jgi:glycosyltransferase involved in cell wall biosynthesis
MKIVFLNDMIYDYAFLSERATWATGGAERQQWLLARALASSGWAVTVGVRRSPLRTGEATYIDGVRFAGIGREQIFVAWYRFFRSERPDWWFWQCASHLFGFGVALAHLAGVKAIFGVGLDRDVRVREALYDRPRWWPAYAFGLSRADRMVLQHGDQRSDLPRSWSRKAYVVPNIALVSQTVQPHPVRPRTVAWIAALLEVKRPDRLIEIARLLPHVRFVVCGGQSTYMTPAGYGDRVIATFRTIPNIDYRGQVSPDEAVRIISAAMVLLSTSDEEGFPQTFLEAWAHGTPTVSLKIDPDRVISQFGLGAVCPDIQGAAAVIDRLISSVDVREEMACRAREYVSRAHSPAAAVSALEHALGVSDRGPARVKPGGQTSSLVPRA